MLLLTHSTSPALAPRSPVTELLRLKAEAELAVARLNAALAATSPATHRAADCFKSYHLLSPWDAPKPEAPTKLVRKFASPSAPRQPSNFELAEIARKLGMDAAKIAERFPAPIPAKKTLTLADLGLI